MQGVLIDDLKSLFGLSHDIAVVDLQAVSGQRGHPIHQGLSRLLLDTSDTVRGLGRPHTRWRIRLRIGVRQGRRFVVSEKTGHGVGDLATPRSARRSGTRLKSGAGDGQSRLNMQIGAQQLLTQTAQDL